MSLAGEATRCRLDVPDGPSLLCVSTPLSALEESLGEEGMAAFADREVAAFVIARPAADLEEVLGDLLPRLAFAGLIGLAAAIAMGFLLSQSVAAPLRRIARAARSVARGSYTQRVPLAGPREVREVAANFNRMTEEVQRSQQTLRDFLMNISHEIKTPLTSIRGFSQAMLDGTIDDEAGVSRSARIINDESTRVLRLVEELLDLSRLESRQAQINQDDVEVAELFSHVEDVFALRSEDSGVSLDIARPPSLRIRGDFDRLEQVLNNLLDNAFRHTATGGKVAVSARSVQQGLVQVSVSDTGKGIPPEDVPHLFERYYRATNGRNTKGYGLGLAITREIVRAHGGDIWAASEPGKGTTFSFTLPLASTDGNGRAAQVGLPVTTKGLPSPAGPEDRIKA
jgi:signal transduction histidine kinase